MSKRWAHPEDQKPRLLLVDHEAEVLPALKAQLEAEGFEVVPMHVGPATGPRSALDHVSLEEVARYALNPIHRIDAVLTNIRQPEFPYGLSIVSDLKKMGFNGVVAAHEPGGEPFMQHHVQEAGGLGLFDKNDGAATAEALQEALKATGIQR